MVCKKNNCDLDFVEHATDALRSPGSRMTESRRLILEEIGKTRGTISATRIVKAFNSRKGLAKIDQVTVYRTLAILEAKNLIHKVADTSEYLVCKHQHCDSMYHILVKCDCCEMFEELDVPREIVSPMLFHLQHQLEFTPNDHVLQMKGVCRVCSD